MNLSNLLIILFYFEFFLASINSKDTKEKEKEEDMCSKTNPQDCEEKYENNDLLYKELFYRENQSEPNASGASSFKYNTTEVDFTIGDEMLSYLDKYNVLPFPKSRFAYKSHGNFLHFIQMAYTKRLPIYFSIDQILEPSIDTIHHIQIIYLEKAFIPLMNSFLHNILHYLQYGNQTWLDSTQTDDALIYFGTAYSLLNTSTMALPLNIQKQCDSNVNQILNQSEEYFTFMSMNKSINTINFNPYGFWKKNQQLIQLNRALRFFQNTIFDIKKELASVLLIGKIIQESSQEKAYEHLKQMLKFLFDEHETTLNPLKITQYFSHHAFTYPFTSQFKQDEFYQGIVSQAIKEELLSFRRNNSFSSEEGEKLFYDQYHYHTSLFFFSFSLDEWVNNKITSPIKGRLIPTVFEEVDIEHNANFMRKITNARYKGNKEKTGSLYKYRDGIDMKNEFKYAKQTIQSSMNNNTALWRSNMILHFHYLLSLSTKHTQQNKNLTKEQKQNNKMKAFQTVMGADVHFQRDINLYEQKVNITYEKGEIVDLVLEDNALFYHELSIFINNFKKTITESQTLIFSLIDNKESNSKLIEETNELLTPIQSGISLIEEGIEMQKEPLMYNHGLQLKLNNLFYYDDTTNEYKGWYVNMYKRKEKEHLFNFNLYIKNYFTMPPVEKISFKGAVVYKAMNYHEIGLMIVSVKQTTVKKLLTYCSYSGNEYPHGWSEKVSLQGLLQLLLKRQ